MAKLVYSMLMSLDGYVADKSGDFQGLTPDEEVFAFVNDLVRAEGTYLYGRRMYEIMTFWESVPLENEQPFFVDFAHIWRAAEKVVFSRTLKAPVSANTRIEKTFDPLAVQQMKASAERDLSIAGPMLAGEAFRAGLVDECHMLVVPTAMGGGTPAFPPDFRLEMALQEERHFRSGVVYLHYRVANHPNP